MPSPLTTPTTASAVCPDLTAKNGSTSVTYMDPSSAATSTQVKTWNNGKAAYTYTYDDKGNIASISDGGQEFDYQYERMTV